MNNSEPPTNPNPPPPDSLFVGNRAKVAAFFEVHAVTITNWLADGCPYSKRGGNRSQDNEYDLQKIAAWLVRRKDRRLKTKTELDMADQVRLENRDILRIKKAKLQKTLMLRDDAAVAVEELIRAFTNGIQNFRDWMCQTVPGLSAEIERRAEAEVERIRREWLTDSEAEK